MAEAFFRAEAGDRYRVASAGTDPAPEPHPEVVAAMRDAGIEIDRGPGRLLDQQLASEAFRIIGMGCNVQEACPALRLPLEDWDLDDPKGNPPDQVAAIRDDIRRRVNDLLATLP